MKVRPGGELPAEPAFIARDSSAHLPASGRWPALTAMIVGEDP
jgi:hypothetical protein